MEEVKDVYNNKERYENWAKKKEILGISKTNEKLVIKFLDDMALGLNISKGSKKGARSPVRLNSLRSRLVFIIKELEKRKIKDITKVNASQLHKLFEDMRTGILKTKTGTPYKSTGDYIKNFKSFWHWYQKTSKNKIEDITSELDTRGEKPKFVYFTEENFNNMLKEASADLKPIISLVYDSGMRVTEMINVKVGDFSEDFKELNIREETSKTFGRKIKLMMCSEQIKNYVKLLDLKKDNFLSQKNPSMLNKEIRKIGKKILTPEQIKFKQLTLYDFRHSSACFWLVRYKSESALKYRFGWKKSDMILYYTELMGMRDTIKDDDMYNDVTKTELEKEIGKLKKEQKKTSPEAIKKQIDEAIEEFVKNQKGLKEYVVTFGSSMKQKPELKKI